MECPFCHGTCPPSTAAAHTYTRTHPMPKHKVNCYFNPWNWILFESIHFTESLKPCYTLCSGYFTSHIHVFDNSIVEERIIFFSFALLWSEYCGSGVQSSNETQSTCAERYHFQPVSDDDAQRIFLYRLLLLSQALILVLQGWQVSGARAPWSVTGSSGRISRAPLSCLPSILPLPIIVNQSSIVSTGGTVQQAIARAAGCGEQHATCLPAITPARGHQGPLSRGCLGRMPQLKLRPFSLLHIVHMAEKHGGVKPLEQLCVDKGAAEDLTANIVSRAVSKKVIVLSQTWPPC